MYSWGDCMCSVREAVYVQCWGGCVCTVLGRLCMYSVGEAVYVLCWGGCVCTGLGRLCMYSAGEAVYVQCWGGCVCTVLGRNISSLYEPSLLLELAVHAKLLLCPYMSPRWSNEGIGLYTHVLIFFNTSFRVYWQFKY